MALHIKFQLSNSEGLMEILVFEGLSHSVVIHPTIHGEPLLTAQAFYYLEQLESVAEIRFENGETRLSQQELEYLIDNYLFEYSKANPKSKISTKLTSGKYWEMDVTDMYAFYDQKNTEALVLDIANDSAVKSIEPVDAKDNVGYDDWCIIKNYSNSIFHSYVKSMNELIDKKVSVVVVPSDGRDGYMGKLRIVKCDYGLLDYYQAHAVDNLSIRDIKADSDIIPIKPASSVTAIESIPVRRISLQNKYNATLLSYYFSGLKEHNALLAFVGFYNVIEFYFEEAPLLLSKNARFELDQIKCVIELLTTNAAIHTFISGMDKKLKDKLNANITTSSSVEISKFCPPNANEYINELGRWLYDIRCAIVHSKKTRRGSPTAKFEPYSDKVNGILPAIPIIKWLAILCIEKDFELDAA